MKTGPIAGALIHLYGWIRRVFGNTRTVINALPAVDALKVGVSMSPDLYGRLTGGNPKYIAQSSHLNSVALSLGSEAQ